MAVKNYGSTNRRLLPETARWRRKRQGVTEAEATFEIFGPLSAMAAMIDAMPVPGQSHPYVGYAILETQEFIGLPNGLRCECRYAGADDADLNRPVYSLAVGDEEVPIETHPKFQTEIGGKPSAPLHGALFTDAGGALTADDAQGAFAGFSTMIKLGPGSFAVNPFAGITSFLDSNNIIYRERYCSRTLPRDGLNLNTIYTGLPGPVPSFGDRNWLYMGYQWEQRGALSEFGVQTGPRIVFDIVREWRLSGRGGWNFTIYG
jgi:hypothetical protein